MCPTTAVSVTRGVEGLEVIVDAAARFEFARLRTVVGPMDYGGYQPDLQPVTVGDIVISQYWIQTPAGTYPIKGSVWTVHDMTQYRESISVAGIVLCLIFVWFCLLGLLFLLMKDRQYTGYVQVTVQGSGFHYATMVPVYHAGVPWSVNKAVNYARALAAAA